MRFYKISIDWVPTVQWPGVPAASQRDPVDSDGRLHNLLGGDHRMQCSPRTFLAGARNRGGDPDLEGGSPLVEAGEESDRLGEKVSTQGRLRVLD